MAAGWKHEICLLVADLIYINVRRDFVLLGLVISIVKAQFFFPHFVLHSAGEC